MSHMKSSTLLNRRSDALFLRAKLNGGMGYDTHVPQKWVDTLPLEALIPRLRRVVRRWLRGSVGRKQGLDFHLGFSGNRGKPFKIKNNEGFFFILTFSVFYLKRRNTVSSISTFARSFTKVVQNLQTGSENARLPGEISKFWPEAAEDRQPARCEGG